MFIFTFTSVSLRGDGLAEQQDWKEDQSPYLGTCRKEDGGSCQQQQGCKVDDHPEHIHWNHQQVDPAKFGIREHPFDELTGRMLSCESMNIIMKNNYCD